MGYSPQGRQESGTTEHAHTYSCYRDRWVYTWEHLENSKLPSGNFLTP